MKHRPLENTMLQCEEITSLTENDTFWIEWETFLLRVQPEFRFLGPAWYSIWSKTWGAEGRWTGRLSILAIRDSQGVLQGILGIGQPRVGPVRVHSYGGHDAPMRMILSAEGWEEAVGRAVGNYVANSGWNLLQIGPILRSYPAEQAMMEQLKLKRKFVHQLRSAPQAICDAPETWDEYRQDVLGKKFSRKINYYERKTERAGEMEIVHYRRPSIEETAVMLDVLATIESRSWMMTRENAHPRFLDQTSQEMWTRLINKSLSPKDQIDCWVMFLDKKPVSFCFALTAGLVRYVLANNYDNGVKDHRTGSTLYKHMMREGIERGIRKFDFGDGELHYKRYWGARYQDFCDTLVVIPNRISGLLIQRGISLRDFLKNLSQPKPGVDEIVEPHSTEPLQSESRTMAVSQGSTH